VPKRPVGIDYSYYPVLKGSLQHQHINQLDEQAILYTQDNIEKYTPTKQLELDTQVWLISTIMLRCLNNNFITRKFVSNYSKLFEYHLTKDIKNKEIRLEILDYFGIQKKDIEFLMVQKVEFIKIHVMDYLEILEEGLHAPQQFHIKQLPMSKGFIYIETQRFLYLLRLALEHRLYQKIKTMKVYTDNKLINDCVSVLKEKYPQESEYTPKSGGIAPTIQELIDKAYREHHLDHRERIRLGIYLQGRGFDMEYILDIFRQLSDFNEKITRQQLQSLKKYIKPLQ
jgi:DNA primase large subunit